MRLKDKIKKVIKQLEIENNVKFLGTTIKGQTYYMFGDGEKITLISARFIIALAKEE